MRRGEFGLAGYKHDQLLDAVNGSLDTVKWPRWRSDLASGSSIEEVSTARFGRSAIGHGRYNAEKTNNILRAIGGLLAIAFLGLIVYSLRDTTPKEGSKAPEFSLVTDSGKRITPDSFAGKVLVLNFWATWCAPCVEEIPSFSEMQKRFAKSGVVVVAVSVDKNQKKYRAFLDRIHVSFETARDPASEISTRYGTFQYPETYIIKDGRIQRKFAQAEDWLSDDLTQYIQSLL